MNKYDSNRDAAVAIDPARFEQGFWAVAASISVIVLGANTALPILTVYQARWGFSTETLTVVYGLYTAGVLAAVFLFGPASDRIGRKRVLLPALAVMACGLLLGALAPNTAALMLSRVLQGLAVGAGVTTAVAALGELHPDPRDHGRIALTATVATVVGLAGGPLVAGWLAEFAPWPTVTPYLLALALTFGVGLAVAAAPETVTRPASFRFQKMALAIPREAAVAFYLATYVEMTAYAVAGTFAGLGASFARDLLGIRSHFFGGLVVALLFACSAAAQIAGRKWRLLRAMVVGLLTLTVGLFVFSAAVLLSSAPAFFASAAILGAGHGLAYLAAQELTDRIAPPDRRAQIFSAFQLGLYVGATAPAIVVGFVAGRAGLAPATLGFAGAIGLLCVAGLAWIRTSRAPALTA